MIHTCFFIQSTIDHSKSGSLRFLTFIIISIYSVDWVIHWKEIYIFCDDIGCWL